MRPALIGLANGPTSTQVRRISLTPCLSLSAYVPASQRSRLWERWNQQINAAHRGKHSPHEPSPRLYPSPPCPRTRRTLSARCPHDVPSVEDEFGSHTGLLHLDEEEDRRPYPCFRAEGPPSGRVPRERKNLGSVNTQIVARNL